MTTPTPRQVLNLPLPDNDTGATTVRGYLVAMLAKLWAEEAGFNAKRPFGNSGWQDDLYLPLVKAGMVPGAIDDEYGYLNSIDSDRADSLIQAAINALGES